MGNRLRVLDRGGITQPRARCIKFGEGFSYSLNDLSKAFPCEDGERQEVAEEAQRSNDQQEDALDPKFNLEQSTALRRKTRHNRSNLSNP